MVNPNPNQITITVTNVTTGQRAGPGGTVNATPGNDLITVSGRVNGVNSSLPCDCCPTNQCVDIQLPNGSIGHVGLNPDGSYLYGPVAIPSGSTSFTVITQYIPTGLNSGTVNVHIGTTSTTVSVSIAITGAAGQICVTDTSGRPYGQCVGSFGSVTVPADAVIVFHGSNPSDTFQKLVIGGQTYCPTGPLTDGQVQYQTGSSNIDVSGVFSNAGTQRTCSPVGVNPHINVVPTQINQGGTVNITGSGFTALGSVQINIGGSGDTTHHADIQGNLNGAMYSIQTAGTYDVYAYDIASGATSNHVSVGVAVNATYMCINGTCTPNPNGIHTTSDCGGVCATTRYSCSNGNCVEDPTGPFSLGSCTAACSSHIQHYSCSGTQCLPDNNGLYTDPLCNGACTSSGCNSTNCFSPNTCVNNVCTPPSPVTLYDCNNGGQCVQTQNGRYTDSACNNTCITPPPPTQKYLCQGGQCVRDDVNGTFASSDCNNTCSSGGCVCPSCCAGYTCQNGACVPSGVGQCGTGQTFVPVYNKCVNNTTLLIAGLLGIGGLYLLLGRKKGNGGVTIVD